MPAVGGAVENTLDAYHEKVKELLGAKYNLQRVDGCVAFQAPGGMERIYDELKYSLASANTEEEKDAVRDAWLNKYDVLSGLADVEDGEDAEK